MKWTSWVTLVGIGAIVGVVVYSSFRVGGVRCEVCIDFRGRQACRAVDADAESEARQGAVTNTCAQLASGVTDMMACERTPPSKSSCQAH